MDAGNRAIGSLINPNPSPGAFAIDRIISGPNTGLGTPSGSPSVSNLPSLALDPAADRMYVATQTSVLVWDNAGLVDGNVPPNRTITSIVPQGFGTRAVNFFSLFLDTTNNRLYAAEPNNGHVQVYNNASTLNGSVTPSRSIASDLGTPCCQGTFGVAVDLARDMLYLGFEQSGSNIAVFDNQSAITTPPPGTPIAPTRVLSIAGGASSFYLDTVNNRLYVAVGGGGVSAPFIRVYDNASTLNGAAPHNRTFQLGTAFTSKYIFVDVPNNRLYAVSDNLVFIIPNASTADGPSVVGTVAQVQSSGSLFSAVAVKP